MQKPASIIKPTLLLDEYKCRSNIKAMAEKAAKSNVIFRPHFKTHQSLEIGRWFKDYGVSKITVSSIEMAQYFSSEWNDITVAFPVNILEIEQINRLAEAISLNLMLESELSANFLSRNVKSEIACFIKIDAGYHRTGISPENLELIHRILEIITASPLISFKGFITHSGDTYSCNSHKEVLEIYHSVAKILNVLKSNFIEDYPKMIISIGDTPSCSIVDDFSGVDEIRPGNFVFYDLVQHSIGASEISQIALVVACPIVAIYETRNEFVIYGGAVHFSKDRIESKDDGVIYGRVVEKTNDAWGDIINGMDLVKISQEHGTITLPEDMLGKYNVGDIVYVFPVHSCLTANLFDRYLSTNGKFISKF